MSLLDQSATTKRRALVARLSVKADTMQVVAKALANEDKTFEQLKSTCEALATLTQDTGRKNELLKAASLFKDYAAEVANIAEQTNKQAELLAEAAKNVEVVEI